MLAYWGAMALMLVFAHLWLRVQLESERLQARSRRELESAIEARTRELAASNTQLRAEIDERRALEEKLRLAHKMEALGRLAGGVAHDYSNILTSVLGNASMLLDELSPQSQPWRDAQEIQNAAQRAAALTQQLLAFSRGGAVETALVGPNEMIAEMQPMLLQLLREDAQLVTSLQPGIPPVRANRGQLEQVVINLVANARDAMPRGGRVRIDTSVRVTAGVEYVVLRVTDTGTGMDADTRARIFDPFFTTKGPEAGTGLGLSIVYGIVQQAGGDVRVTSAPGAGSQFEVVWPAATGLPEVPPLPDLAALRGSELILVVEDEPDLRKLVCRMLEQFGYRTLDAHSGEEALKLAAREPVDLVLTDVIMPQMSGAELASRLQESGARVPVLFMSGHLDHPIARSGELPQGASLLAKPFTRERLCEKVRQVLDTARARA
jgi:signal transduction histidine kinase